MNSGFKQIIRTQYTEEVHFTMKTWNRSLSSGLTRIVHSTFLKIEESHVTWSMDNAEMAHSKTTERSLLFDETALSP